MEASLVESPAFSAHASTCSASSATSCSAQTPRSSFRSDMPLTESEIEEGKVDLSIALAKSSLEQKEDEAVHHGQQNGLALTSRTRRTHGLGLDEELDREEEKADTFDAEPIGVAHNRASLERSTASASTTNSSLTSTQSFSRISSPAAPLAQHDIVSLLAPVSQTSNLSSPSRQPISPSNSIRASPLSKDLDRPKRGSLFGMSAFRSKKEKPISPLSAQSSQAQYKPSHASDTMSLRQGSSVASGSIRSRSSTDFGSQNRDSLPRFPASRNSMMQYQKCASSRQKLLQLTCIFLPIEKANSCSNIKCSGHSLCSANKAIGDLDSSPSLQLMTRKLVVKLDCSTLYTLTSRISIICWS